MVPYKKDGHEYILIANSSRGVMKLKADKLESYPAIESPTVPTAPHHVAGVPYELQADLKGVQHLQPIDGSNALLLVSSATNVHCPRCAGDPAAAQGLGPLSLQTIPLP